MKGKISFKFPDIQLEWNDGDTSGEVSVSFSRIEKQFQRAQYLLDSQVMDDMVPYMPQQTGSFINITRGMSQAIAGSGYVIAAAPPTGRFLYFGKVMIDPKTGSPWAQKGAKKVVTEKPLTYSNPKATPEWFETAKKEHGKAWVKNAKEAAGGG